MLVGLTYNDKEYFYDRDVLGNINRIIDITGKEYVRYKYTAYGEVIKEINSSLTTKEKQIANGLKEKNIFIYKGYCYDEETNLYYLNARYYSPIICRFINYDDIEYLDYESINGLNLYCYCFNNPVMYVDPSGHFSITNFLISVAIGALISITMEAIEDKKDGQFFNDKDFWDYFGAGVSGTIGGMAGNPVAAILLGGIAPMVETAISDETTTYNMMTSFLSGAIGGLIGFGIGEIAKYAASLAEAGIGKVVAKFTSNNTVNRMFAQMGATTTKIGTKNIWKIASGLAAADKNYFAVTISSLASGWF